MCGFKAIKQENVNRSACPCYNSYSAARSGRKRRRGGRGGRWGDWSGAAQSWTAGSAPLTSLGEEESRAEWSDCEAGRPPVVQRWPTVLPGWTAVTSRDWAAVVPYWPTVELPGWSTVMRDWAAVRLPVTEQVCVSHQM